MALIGRDDELAQLCDLVPRHRITTLVGPGGVGKTRLAAEVLQAAGPALGGSLWVDLVGATDGNVAAAWWAALRSDHVAACVAR